MVLNLCTHVRLNMVPEVERIVFRRFQRVFEDILCFIIVQLVQVVGSHQHWSRSIYKHSQPTYHSNSALGPNHLTLISVVPYGYSHKASDTRPG